MEALISSSAGSRVAEVHAPEEMRVYRWGRSNMIPNGNRKTSKMTGFNSVVT
jgi:hypothetical protein